MNKLLRIIAIISLSVLFVACGGGNGGDTTPPTIVSTSPGGNAVDVTTNIAPSATFSEAIKVSTITTASFTLVDDSTNPVSGAISYNSNTYTSTFTPTVALANSTTYTATISTAVTDSAGNALATNYSWSFTTLAPDTTPPVVSSIDPAENATDVPVGITPKITFSESMNATTITNTSFTLVDASTNTVSGAVNYDAGTKTAIFTPSANLTNNTTYTVTITTAVTDSVGNALAANYSWSFTTIASETVAPTVSTTNPLHRARGALLTGPVTVLFSEALDPSTVTVSSFVVSDVNGPVSGSVDLSQDGLTASFTPQTPFNYKTHYDVTLTTAIHDLAGNQLAGDYTWFFNSGLRLAAGFNYICARIGADGGGLKCWGDNTFGQLGQGDTERRGDASGEIGNALSPIDLGTDRKVVQVVAGNNHTCARLDDATVKCWGRNTFGELGLGDTQHRGDGVGEMGDALETVNLGSSRVALELAAGADHTCARLDNNNIKCWGQNNLGQLGQGDIFPRGDSSGEMGGNLPKVELGTDRKARELSAGSNHTCARLDDNTIKCWGSSGNGQLGLGDTTSRGDAPGEMGDALPSVELGGGTILGFESHGTHNCARIDIGISTIVKCWGDNSYGQLGLGDTESRGDAAGEMGTNLPAAELGTGRTADGLAIGYQHSCARFDDGMIKCWGLNTRGQLGQGDIVNRGNQANQMSDNLAEINLGINRTVEEIVANGDFTCARLDTDDIKCWGDNSYGQLGLGDTGNRGDETNEMGENLLSVDIGN